MERSEPDLSQKLRWFEAHSGDVAVRLVSAAQAFGLIVLRKALIFGTVGL